MSRSLIITIVALFILVAAGVGVYFYFFAGGSSLTTSSGGTSSLPAAGASNPPSTNGGGDTSGTTAGGATNPVPVATVSAKLVQVSKGPVALGEAVIDMKAANASSSAQASVEYIDRQSGNVYTYLTGDKTIIRTSNKTIPGIQYASWLPSGATAFVRYLSGDGFTTVNTYALSAASTTGGFFLPQNISDLAVSSTSVLMLASGVNGSVASLARLDGTHQTQLFTTALSQLRVSFIGKNQYLAFTKPSGSLLGDAFSVDSSGRFSTIAGPLNGLSALASPSGKWALVSYTTNGAMQLELINTATGSATTLPVATIADKCVWASDDSAAYCGIPVNPPTGYTYPDDWYQGAAHFSDRIWKIDVTSRYAQLVLDFSTETKADVDAESLAIDPLNTTLVFINKNDLSLWSYSF